MTPKFNKKRPHGTVHGLAGVAYDQDGTLFNSNYQPVDMQGKLLYPNEPAPPPERTGDIAEDAPKGPTPIDPEDVIDEEPRIDLKAWRDGTVRAAWATVASEVHRQLGAVVKNKQEALDVVNKAFPLPGQGVGIQFE